MNNLLRILELKVKVEEKQTNLCKEICKFLKIKTDDLLAYNVIRRSIDARKKQQIFFSYMLDIELAEEESVLKRIKNNLIKSPKETYIFPKYGNKLLHQRPVIIGFGPSGLFAGLILAKMGLKPLIFERGDAVSSRIDSVSKFWNERILNPESNIQFGEGGAGTFSDGKLTTRVKDLRSKFILEEFVKNGANEDILTVHNPHIGTDILVNVVQNIRKEIISLGGEIHFNSLVQNFIIQDGAVKAISVNNKKVECDDLILAIGHSARDTFQILYNSGVMISQKAFAVGVRIEHPQFVINKAQYGEKYYDFPSLGAAEYKLTYRASNNKSVYTFCMCPGGTVVPSSSEVNTVVVNGMSEYARDKTNANSALVCTVDESDFESSHPLAGMNFQRELEQKAFILGGNNYCAPVQLVKDFINNVSSIYLGDVSPSYVIGNKLVNLNELFPQNIAFALKEAIISLDNKLHGFALDDAVLTGVETRTSSPIRINRDSETLESINVKGLYPTGEGAGYSGGIMSSAMDGIKVAEKIINKYKI